MNDSFQADDMSSLQTLKALGRHRWIWRFVAIFFFVPSLFYIVCGPEKRFLAARENGDVEAARDAVNSMRFAALLGVPLGIVSYLVLRVLDFQFYE